MSTSTAVTPEGFALKESVARLSELILSKHPTMPTLLREIHTTVRKYPEQVTLLSHQEIGIIVSGLQVQTNTFIAQSVSKPAAAKTLTTKLKNNAAAALGLD